MDEKRYLVDGKTTSANDIIQEAKKLDPYYGVDGRESIWKAIGILQSYSYTVEDNPEYKPYNQGGPNTQLEKKLV